MGKDPYKTLDEIIKRDHETLTRLNGDSRNIRVKKKDKK